MYRTRPGAHGMYKTAEAKDWATECQWEFRRAHGELIAKGRVDLHLRLFLKIDRDIDSCFKIVLDSLQEFAYQNDSQVGRVIAYKERDNCNPRIEIDIMSALDNREETGIVATEVASS